MMGSYPAMVSLTHKQYNDVFPEGVPGVYLLGGDHVMVPLRFVMDHALKVEEEERVRRRAELVALRIRRGVDPVLAAR